MHNIIVHLSPGTLAEEHLEFGSKVARPLAQASGGSLSGVDGDSLQVASMFGQSAGMPVHKTQLQYM
jgi:hypothetical protein